MKMSVGGLLSTIMFAVIGVIVIVGVASPIITDFAADLEEGSTMATIVGVLPIFMILLVLMAVAGALIAYTRNDQ